jgi:hypothetical protein
MFGSYLAACIFLTIAGLQSQKLPAHQGSPFVSIAGSVAGIGSTGMLIAGFFILDWWAPLVALVAGPAASTFLPADFKRTPSTLILICAFLGLCLAIQTLIGAGR